MSARTRLRAYRFDDTLIEPDQRRLLIAGTATPITTRAFDLLVLLVERGGELVTKDECFDRVWPGLVVEENNLQQQVSVLRKVLGSATIETVPGRGYRFVPSVVEADAAHRPPAADVEARASASPRTNLPRPLTTLFGQQVHLARCTSLLGKNRLVTVTGIGGVGKTRLALEMATACANDFADGVWFVDLGPVSDERLVPEAVASVVAADPARERALDTVQLFLHDRRALLILDNCEHVLNGCAGMVAALLRTCAHVKLVATSREPLHVKGEAVYPLSTLAVPELGPPLSLDGVVQCDAVRLFVDRATAVRPDFRLTEGNMRAVAEICTRLDGIPLAIERAAARVRALSVDAIAERLGDRFQFLTSRDNTGPPRQKSLRAMLDWSYDLLSDPEQRILQRLAVFAGGWTFAAAKAVVEGDGIESQDVLDLHGYLVDKSLIVVEQSGDRYRLLETVREYAADRLEQSGEGESARARHLLFYVDLAERAEPHFVGPHENVWHARFDVERHNVLSAYKFAVRSRGRADEALRLVHGCRSWIGGHAFDSGQPIFLDAIAASEADNEAKVRGLVAAAFVSYFRGGYDDTLRYAREAASIACELKLSSLELEALNWLAYGYLAIDDRDGARSHYAQVEPRARESGDLRLQSWVLNGMAELHSVDRHLELAELLHDEVENLARQLRSSFWMLIVQLRRARTAISRGDASRAANLIKSAIEASGDDTLARNAHHVFESGAALAAIMGDAEHAMRFWGASNRSFADTSQHRRPADEYAYGPCIATAKAALGDAAYRRLEVQGVAMSSMDALAAFKQWLSGHGLVGGLRTDCPSSAI